jgi:amino acid permease
MATIGSTYGYKAPIDATSIPAASAADREPPTQSEPGWTSVRDTEGVVAQRTVGLHSSGGMGMQASGSNILGEPLLGDGDDQSAAGSDQGPDKYLSPRERNIGILGSVANTMNAVIGTGILALPVAFSKVGWALGSGILLVCGFMCFVSLVALGQVTTTVGGTSYGDTIEKSVGPRSANFVSVIVSLYTWGVCVVYHVVISTNLTDLLADRDLITEEIIPGIENRRFWIVVSTLGVLIPFCMLPNFDKLKYAAMFATSSMMYLSGVIAAYLFVSASRNDVPVWEAGRELVTGATDPELRTPIGPRDSRTAVPLLHPLICCVPPYTAADGVEGCVDGTEAACCVVSGTDEVCCDAQTEAAGIAPWKGAVPAILDENVFSSFSTFLFALATHTVIPQVIVELIEPSTPRIAGVMGGVCVGSLTLYLVVGLTGYLMFGTCVCDNISLSFGPSVLVAVGQGFVIASVSTGYATLCWPCRDAILDLLYPVCMRLYYDGAGISPPDPLPNPSLTTKRVVALLVCLTAASVAWFDPPFAAVLAVLGAVGGGLCGFVMPALAYLMVYHQEKSWGQKVSILACSSSKPSGLLNSVVATTDTLHTAWLVPDLLHSILLRQLWLRRRKYYTPASQGKALP